MITSGTFLPSLDMVGGSTCSGVGSNSKFKHHHRRIQTGKEQEGIGKGKGWKGILTFQRREDAGEREAHSIVRNPP
jgi:hypothetical protein